MFQLGEKKEKSGGKLSSPHPNNLHLYERWLLIGLMVKKVWGPEVRSLTSNIFWTLLVPLSLSLSFWLDLRGKVCGTLQSLNQQWERSGQVLCATFLLIFA